MSAEIYALIDPRNDDIRYIGKSVDPSRRLQAHLTRRGVNPYKDNWIEGLVDEGLIPNLFVLETINDAEWDSAERWWIGVLRDCGEPLTNLCDGGETGPDPTGRAHSLESKAKMAEARKHAWEEGRYGPRAYIQGWLFSPWLGKKHTKEARQRMSASRQDRSISEETAKKISTALRGRKPHPNTLEAVRKWAAGRKGKPRSAETRRKISASLRGRPGRKHSGESKRKMAEIKRKHWADGIYDDVSWR